MRSDDQANTDVSRNFALKIYVKQPEGSETVIAEIVRMENPYFEWS